MAVIGSHNLHSKLLNDGSEGVIKDVRFRHIPSFCFHYSAFEKRPLVRKSFLTFSLLPLFCSGPWSTVSTHPYNCYHFRSALLSLRWWLRNVDNVLQDFIPEDSILHGYWIKSVFIFVRTLHTDGKFTSSIQI
jgi:hypothetical protein